MTLEDIAAKLSQKMGQAAHLRARVKFDFGPDGYIVLDSTQTPPVLSQEDTAEADTTLACSLDTFEAILAGTQDPSMAYTTGRLKIKGSLSLAMKLNSILED